MKKSDKVIKNVVVNTKDDIEKTIKIYMPGSDHPLRKSLEKGFDFVKRRIEYNKLAKTNMDVDSMFCYVDSLIHQRLGGKREGMYITWDLEDGKYKFDPQNGELSKSDLETN